MAAEERANCGVCWQQFNNEDRIQCRVDGCATEHPICIACVVQLKDEQCPTCRQSFRIVTPRTGARFIRCITPASLFRADIESSFGVVKTVILVCSAIMILYSMPALSFLAIVAFLLCGPHQQSQ